MGFLLLVVSGKTNVDGITIGSTRGDPQARLDLKTAFKPHPKVQGIRKEIPYIPASSWIGVMRHLLEKYYNLPAQTPRISRRPNDTIVAPIHECETKDEVLKCPVCKIFVRREVVAWFGDMEPFGSSYMVNKGAMGGEYIIDSETNKEIVKVFIKDEVIIPRDAESVSIPKQIAKSKLALTSSGNEVKGEELVKKGFKLEPIPRQVQVVSGIFKFDTKFAMDKLLFDDLKTFFIGLGLVEDRFVGRRGSRGYGRIEFDDLTFKLRTKEFYEGKGEEITIKIPHKKPRDIIANWKNIGETYEQAIPSASE
ncbi:MAG: RAMP superfamily CRISPR-associated protein [Candidatus Freyarchaeum deiterrae]